MAEKKLSKLEQLQVEYQETENSCRKLSMSSVKQEDLRRAIEVSSCALGRFPGLKEMNMGDSEKALVDLLTLATKQLQDEIAPPCKKAD